MPKYKKPRLKWAETEDDRLDGRTYADIKPFQQRIIGLNNRLRRIHRLGIEQQQIILELYHKLKGES